MKTEILQELRKITPEEQRILEGEEIDRTLYNLNQSMTVDCKKLLKHGRLIELRPHTRFVHFPQHTHNYVEVVYMCEGTTRHIINGSSVTLQAGELLFLGQHAVQEIEPAAESDIAVNFIILPEFFDTSLDMIGGEHSLIREFLLDCLKSGSQNIAYLHFKVADLLPVQNLVENLIWMLLHRQPYKRRLDAVTMGLLFLHLMNFVDKMELGQDHFEEETVLRVYQYIESHYRDGELTQIAEELHMGDYQLSRLIKAVTGKNYTTLLQEKRLSQAAYLLKNTNLSVTDISLAVGYHNFSYFYRIFGEKYGISPKKFRNMTSDIRGGSGL